MLGYPRFFTQDGGEDWIGRPVLPRAARRCACPTRCGSTSRSASSTRDRGVRALDGAEFVDLYDVPDGVELCSGADPTFMNGALPNRQVESFHPNAFGQA